MSLPQPTTRWPQTIERRQQCPATCTLQGTGYHTAAHQKRCNPRTPRKPSILFAERGLEAGEEDENELEGEDDEGDEWSLSNQRQGRLPKSVSTVSSSPTWRAPQCFLLALLGALLLAQANQAWEKKGRGCGTQQRTQHDAHDFVRSWQDYGDE